MLKGTLDDFTLPDIFRLMSLAKKTGRMDVSRGAGEGRVFFDGGDVYYAESSLSREPLGQKLIRARALTESQLNKALDTHAQTGKRVGDIMMESGMVTSEQIEAAVAQQIEDAVFDLLRWDLGEFTWEAGAMLEVEVPISVSVENLIMEASRRLDELDVIQRRIPGEYAVLTMAPAPPEGAAEINITPEEWRALVLVDGSRTVGEIGRMIGKDDFETMKILYGLLSAGLVQVDHEASAAAAEAAQMEPPAEAETAEAHAVTSIQPETDVPAEAALEVVEEPAVEGPAVEDVEAEAEVEVVAAEPGGELEDFLSDVTTEPVEEPAPEIHFELGAAAEPEEIEMAGSGMGVDEVLTGGATAEGATDESPEDVEVVAAANGAPALMDVLEASEPPAPVELPGSDEIEAETVEAVPQTDAEAETVSVGDAEDPFLSGLLDQHETEAVADVSAPAPEPPAAEPVAVEPAAEVESAAEEEAAGAVEPVPEEEPAGSPSVDRAAVVRELAGLFDEDRPKPRPSGPAAPPSPGAPPEDQRKRVEDDEQINKGVISRLIKGVKGL